MTTFSVNFLRIPIWVQVWGLPFDLINEEAGRDISSGIGQVVTVDYKAISSNQACFLRVRVEMPLDKPIRRGHKAKACTKDKLRDGKNSTYGDWLRVGYRKLNDNNNINKPSSPPWRNTKENDGNQDTNPLLQPPNNSEPRTSQANTDEHATIIENMEQKVTVFTGMCEIGA
nr:hypothetical protein CFP56_45355 [Quercus suber]